MSEPIIRALIVDDEPLARDGVRLNLQKDPNFEVVGECANGHEAIASILRLKPDLVFLDVQMPELSGFDVLERIPNDQLPLVVFVTAFDRFALKAFDVHALDYVLKPIDPDRFQDTLDRIKGQFHSRRTSELTINLLAALDSLRADLAATASTPLFLTRFVIRETERIYFVPVEEVDWIESADYYVKLHAGSKTHLLRETLAHLETQLDPHVFVRIHRSTTVRVDRIKEIRRQTDGDPSLVLIDGTVLRFGRSYRDTLDRLLGDLLRH
jgi:two-component system, LytTR family, response regulator